QAPGENDEVFGVLFEQVVVDAAVLTPHRVGRGVVHCDEVAPSGRAFCEHCDVVVALALHSPLALVPGIGIEVVAGDLDAVPLVTRTDGYVRLETGDHLHTVLLAFVDSVVDTSEGSVVSDGDSRLPHSRRSADKVADAGGGI